MKKYHNKTIKNKLKYHTMRLSYAFLAIIGSLYMVNALIEYAKTINLYETRTITLYNHAQASKDEARLDVITYIEQQNGTETLLGEFSAYNAEVGQTDDDPFTMANGERVYIGAVANNCLTFGTRIKAGGVVYTVSDRMNRRYSCDHFDIFFESKAEAIQFGRQKLNYQIL